MRIGVIKEWVDSRDSMTFGEIRLKPMQMAILKCNRTHDVLVNLPTGFGKSLLFQYPASQLRDKCIVVFVPLKALLWDCLKQAELHRLTAVECDSAFIRKYEAHGFLPQLLFLTPERLFMNQTVMNFLELLNLERKIELFVIDEAHCISEWGSDFRPDYARLGEIRNIFPGTRLLGMSATIPPEALKDLTAKLQITGCYYFQSSSNRPNLIYEVMQTEKPKVASNVIDYVKFKKLQEESGIVYCQTIKNAEEVFRQLRNYDISCCLFHSKMPERKREENFEAFMSGKVKCIVATICFGMGVNKKNIRYVINVGISLSAENYYQESGRAGRDGEISFCLLMTYGSDISPLQYLINESTKKITLARRRLYKLKQLKNYTNGRDCRKRMLFKLLGEEFSAEQCRKTCDFCINDMGRNTFTKCVDYSEKGFWIIEEMQRFRQNVTKLQLVGFLKGRSDAIKNKITKEKYHNLFQFLKEDKNENIEQLVEQMITRGLLVQISERVKIGKIKRVIQYLKPCTKTELMKQKPKGLTISIVSSKLQLTKSNKEHIPNPYVSKKFEQYVIKKAKSLDAPTFELEFEKQKVESKVQEDEEMKEIKMVEIEQFFDDLFPENMAMSKGNTSEDEVELDAEEIMKLENETQKDDVQAEFQDIFIPKKQTSKKEEDSDDDSLFLMIRKKKEELRQQNEQKQKQKQKETLVVKRKLPTKNDFL